MALELYRWPDEDPFTVTVYGITGTKRRGRRSVHVNLATGEMRSWKGVTRAMHDALTTLGPAGIRQLPLHRDFCTRNVTIKRLVRQLRDHMAPWWEPWFCELTRAGLKKSSVSTAYVLDYYLRFLFGDSVYFGLDRSLPTPTKDRLIAGMTTILVAYETGERVDTHSEGEVAFTYRQTPPLRDPRPSSH